MEIPPRDGCANRTPGGKMSSAFRRLPTPSSGKEVPSTAMDLSYAGKVLPVRVLVVDDHPAFRKALSSALSLVEDIEVAGEAGGGLAACEEAARLHPDAIIM